MNEWVYLFERRARELWLWSRKIGGRYPEILTRWYKSRRIYYINGKPGTESETDRSGCFYWACESEFELTDYFILNIIAFFAEADKLIMFS